MRKIYLLLLLVSGFAFGQVDLKGDAHYELESSVSLGDGATGGACGNGGLDWLFVTRSDGPIYLKPNDGSGWQNTFKSFKDSQSKNYEFTESNLITSFSIHSTKRESYGIGNSSCHITDTWETTELIGRNEIVKYVNHRAMGGVLANSFNGTVTMNTFPVINLRNTVPANDIIGTKSSITILPIAGVLDQYYNWMYHIDGDMTPYTVMEPDPDCEGGSAPLLKKSAKIIDPDNPPIYCPDIPVTKYKDKWISLPSGYQNNNSLNIRCKDFLPFSAVGKKIQLKANSLGALVTLQYRLSAPIVVSAESFEPSCKGVNDGSARFLFDDTLSPGEMLNYTLLDVTTGTPTPYYGVLTIADDKSFVINGLPVGVYELQLIGFKDGLNTSVDADKQNLKTFEVKSPIPVGFSVVNKNDIRCFGGNDGEIQISASGGVNGGIYQCSTDHGATWKAFSNGTNHTISGLPLGFCYIKVRKVKNVNDTVGCVAKVSSSDDTEKEEKENIGQPTAPISINYTVTDHPTFYGATNGKIIAAITGGTIDDDKTYWYEWKNDSGTIFAAKGEYNADDKTYNITLDGVPAGKYYLTLRDKNFDANKNNVSCTQVAPEKELIQPKKLVVTFEVKKSISCNAINKFGNDDDFDPQDEQRDESQDGILIAHVRGGVPLSALKNKGFPYFFYWKKQLKDSTWVDFTNVNDSIATNLSHGKYSLNIKDANGIILGTYENNVLKDRVDASHLMKEPPVFSILPFDKMNVSCLDGNNGSAKVNVDGGTSPYKSYTWYNVGDGVIDNDKVSGLIAGSYFVEIKDNNGCVTQGSVPITQPPSPVSLNYTTVDNPKFSGATNGKIVVEVTGGTLKDDNSYGYLWKNSKGDIKVATSVYDAVSKVYTLTLDNLPADKYSLTVWDKNYNAVIPAQIVNCSIIDSEITLEQPKPLVVTFEIKQTISCNASNEFGSAKDTEPADGKRDESQDGILVAHVTGGIQLLTDVNNGLPYYYYWKKQQTDGTWIDWNDQDETAEHLSHGNYALNIKDRNGIVLGIYGVNNELIAAKDSIQFMKEPSLFDVSIAKGEVYCNGGNDGWATATVVGGTAPYQYDWSNGETISENTVLKAGDYSIVINDDKKCVAKEKVTILEPIDPITLNYTAVINPTFYKATNGKIVVEVKGGTPFANKSYGYEWKNSSGNLQTVTSQVINGVYTLTLNGLPEDVYTLTIKDANYNPATNKIGCTIINSQKPLDDPEPLIVTFEVKRTISCNVSNEFGNEIDTIPNDGQRDESQDGILVAHVTGGIQLAADQNNGLPYFYTWKKQKADKSWISWNDHDETAENLSNGIYALNIEDKNGIKLGTYVNNLLTTAIDVTQDMPEPTKLVVTFTKFDVGCTVGNDGWAKANVTGGTAPYTYQWTNEATTDKIENLTTNNYFVIITDAKGCTVQGSIFVGDPNGILATETTKNPTCFLGNDGTINLDVKGGNLPYTYKWSTGATTKDVTQLKAGDYEVAITCPDCCVYKKYFTLKDPAPIVVNLGLDRTLCNEQSLDLEAAIQDTKAQYSWTATNGFTADTPKVNLTKAGVYHVKVTSGLGCIGEDDIEIKTNNIDISSEFFLSSQAYLDEEVILVNASNPFGENTQWILPENVNVVEQMEKFITLKFNKAGVYTIALKQTQGDCYALYSKNISVETRSTLPNDATTNTQFINDFLVTPNPNDGNFNALINLQDSSSINLRLFSYNGAYTLIQKKDSGKKNYAVDFNVKLASGVYVLVLETAQQTLVKKIIIY
jgi:hypothetical protein